MEKIAKFESADVNLTIVIVNERIADIRQVTIIGGMLAKKLELT